MINTIKIQRKDNRVEEMSIDEFARWACLIEGIENVTKKGSELGISTENDDWIKPLAFQKYIEERFHSMKHDLTVEAAMGNL